MPNLPRERAETWQTGKARKRVVIEGVKPEIDGGRFPIKRTKGERVKVEAEQIGDDGVYHAWMADDSAVPESMLPSTREATSRGTRLPKDG